MQSIVSHLDTLISDAIIRAFPDLQDAPRALVQGANKQTNADYQSNAALPLAKTLKQPPQAIAEQIIQQLPENEMIALCELSGPGFINIGLKASFTEARLQAMQLDKELGISKGGRSFRTVVDYGSPNVAKAMHVGHLRSTIIGDAVVRLLACKGHEVIRQNHVGDWGTQFGMLIEHMIENNITVDSLNDIQVLNTLYQTAKQRFDNESVFAESAKKRVVALQGGDAATLVIWQMLVNKSLEHFQSAYDQLGVSLKLEDVRGESAYNDDLPNIISDLKNREFLQESQGAQVLFLDGFVDKDKNPLPMILQKADGGYLYATTDMATAKYRCHTLHADRMIYVVDARQKQHFDMLFAAVRLAGYVNKSTQLEFLPFGTILGADRKPFKTREGKTIALEDLMLEVISRARNLYMKKNPDAPSEKAHSIAKTIAIGAIKYADLSNDKINDIVFDWDKMLAFDGNTAPYLLNAYVRIASIQRKAAERFDTNIESSALQLTTDQELTLAKQLIQYPELIDQLCQNLAIHRLCHYLYQTATLFHRFYEHCPILNTEEACRSSRLQLCDITKKILAHGLNLLGIETLDAM